jgi:hypothetical protein
MDKYKITIDVGGILTQSEVMASNDLEAADMCLLEARWNNPDCCEKDFRVVDTKKLTRTHMKRLRGKQ